MPDDYYKQIVDMQQPARVTDKWICLPCWHTWSDGAEAEEITIGRIVSGDPPCAWCGEPSETILNPVWDMLRKVALVIARRRA